VPDPERGQFFSPDSVWNTPVPRDAEIDPASDVVVAELARQASGGATFNYRRYSIPVYTVPEDQPTVRVRDSDDGFMDQDHPLAWGDVPLPPDAAAADGEDRHLVVWQPSTDTLWEFWDFTRGEDGAPAARHGARITGVSSHPGWLPVPFGASATGLPMIAGTVLAEDVARGRIDHALAMAILEPRRELMDGFATRTDGWSERPEAPIEGSRFRLDPDLDIDALGLHPFVALIAHAAQDYGIILRDKAGAVVLFGEDPRGIGRDPFAGLMAGANPTSLMRSFPWDRLQLLKTEPECCWTRELPGAAGVTAP
jgi:hypothetical protein